MQIKGSKSVDACTPRVCRQRCVGVRPVDADKCCGRRWKWERRKIPFALQDSYRSMCKMLDAVKVCDPCVVPRINLFLFFHCYVLTRPRCQRKLLPLRRRRQPSSWYPRPYLWTSMSGLPKMSTRLGLSGAFQYHPGMTIVSVSGISVRCRHELSREK